MRVLGSCSLGGAGHLGPLSGPLRAAQRAGHEVRVVAPPTMADMVASAGFEWAGGGVPPEDEIRPIREQIPVLPAADASMLGDRELFGRLATHWMLPTVREVAADWRPDLILRDPCEHASAIAAAELELPVAQVGISVAIAEWRAIGRSAPVIDVHHPGASHLEWAMPYLTRFPASLDPSRFATTLRYHVPPPAPSGRLPDWWSGSTAPLVYVTFGTVLGWMTYAADVYATALAAVADLDARVLLTVGRQFDATLLGEVPPNVHVEAWVDQVDVFQEASVVVTHGGSGTVYGALAAGLPVVGMPVFADQFTNSRIVAAAGAGLVVEREQDPAGRRRVIGSESAPELTAAVRQVLAEPSYARRAAEISAEMAATPTVDDVVAGLLG